jgi:hypothetical protein
LQSAIGAGARPLSALEQRIACFKIVAASRASTVVKSTTPRETRSRTLGFGRLIGEQSPTIADQ